MISYWPLHDLAEMRQQKSSNIPTQIKNRNKRRMKILIELSLKHFFQKC